MREAIEYLPRRAADLVFEALADTRVVVVHGARQAGKRTLAKRLGSSGCAGCRRPSWTLRDGGAPATVPRRDRRGAERIRRCRLRPRRRSPVARRGSSPGVLPGQGRPRWLSGGRAPGEPSGRRRFFESYLADLIARDVKQVADIERTDDMRRLIALLAAQTGGLLNLSRLASAIGISAPTVRSYLEILETIYLVKRVPAWPAPA